MHAIICEINKIDANNFDNDIILNEYIDKCI